MAIDSDSETDWMENWGWTVTTDWMGSLDSTDWMGSLAMGSLAMAD